MKKNLHSEYRFISPDNRRDQACRTVWFTPGPSSGGAARDGSPSWALPDLPLAGPELHSAETSRVGLLTTIRRIIGAFRLWRERAHSRQQLRQCSDHTLQDIGLRREEIGYEFTPPYSHCD